MATLGLPLPDGWWTITSAGVAAPSVTHLATAAVSVRLSHFLRRRIFSSNLLSVFVLPSSSFKDWNEKCHQLKEFNFVQWADESLSETCQSCIYFFNNGQGGKGTRETRRGSSPATSSKGSFGRRKWTNILLGANILLFVAQLATKGKLMLWGAKINSLINKGQIWRLVTSTFLHANIGHLMINCFSLNSVGPTVESMCGARRFMTIYLASGVASTAMSYWLCQAPAVGASGAIFGLVGSVTVFLLRHRGLSGSGTEDLKHIARIIFLNMIFGLMTRGIDNWGHLGGLLGGVAASWFLGPAWQYTSMTRDGRKVFVDKAPVYTLLKLKKP